MLFLTLLIPNVIGEDEGNLDRKIYDKMFMARVKFRGSVDLTILPKSLFCFSVAGFGFCPFIRLKLSEGSHMEIYKLSRPWDKTVLDGNTIVIIIGFIGYHRELIDWFDITIKGIGVYVIWR